MSRNSRERNRIRMRKAEKRSRREAQRHARINPGGGRGRKSTPALWIDKFSGRKQFHSLDGGINRVQEVQDAMNKSDNPHYLVGRVTQNELYFDAEEIKTMADATFDAAMDSSFDAWYPSQYAIGLAGEADEFLRAGIAYFLTNFALGLKNSAIRAAARRGEPQWACEATHLEARLNKPESLERLTHGDACQVRDHIKGHPALLKVKEWCQSGSGQRMTWHGCTRRLEELCRQNAPGGGIIIEPNELLASEVSRALMKAGAVSMSALCPHQLEESDLHEQGMADLAEDIRNWQQKVRSKGKVYMVNDLIQGNIATWLGDDSSHLLFIKAADATMAHHALDNYDEDELGEWFSLMTSYALGQVTCETGMGWKTWGRANPIQLVELPDLSFFRSWFSAGKPPKH